MNYLDIDGMLGDANKKKKKGEEKWTRNLLGIEIWGNEKSYEVIHSTISVWANPMKGTVPSYSCAKKICKILGITLEQYDTYIKENKVKPKK